MASRIPHGIPVTFEKLRRIETAESLVKSVFNVRQVRIRDHQEIARIEVGQHEIKEMFDTRKLIEIDSKLKSLGFKYVTLDLSGYKSKENLTNTTDCDNKIRN